MLAFVVAVGLNHLFAIKSRSGDHHSATWRVAVSVRRQLSAVTAQKTRASIGAQGVLFVGAPRLGTALCPLPQPAHAQAKRGKAMLLLTAAGHQPLPYLAHTRWPIFASDRGVGAGAAAQAV